MKQSVSDLDKVLSFVTQPCEVWRLEVQLKRQQSLQSITPAKSGCACS